MRKRAEGMVFMERWIRFKFVDSGEIWELDLDGFHERAGYWFREARKHMMWFYSWWPENCTAKVLQCTIYIDGVYCGSITYSPVKKHLAYHWWLPPYMEVDYAYGEHRMCYIRRGDYING